MIVVDAAAVVDVLLDAGDHAGWIREALAIAQEAQAPALVDYEVASAMRRLVLNGAVPPERGAAALTDLRDFRLVRHPPGPYLARIWELRASLTSYDASYVALAEALDCPLVTSDLRLARSHGHDAEIRSPV